MLSPSDAICAVALAGGVPGTGVASPAAVVAGADAVGALDAALVSAGEGFDPPPQAVAAAAAATVATIIVSRRTRMELRRFLFMT